YRPSNGHRGPVGSYIELVVAVANPDIHRTKFPIGNLFRESDFGVHSHRGKRDRGVGILELDPALDIGIGAAYVQRFGSDLGHGVDVAAGTDSHHGRGFRLDPGHVVTGGGLAIDVDVNRNVALHHAIAVEDYFAV